MSRRTENVNTQTNYRESFVELIRRPLFPVNTKVRIGAWQSVNIVNKWTDYTETDSNRFVRLQ